MTRYLQIIPLVLISAGISAHLYALDSKESRQSLKGLAGINVAVEQAESMKKIGVESDKIKTAVEGKLRTAGIRVLTDAERLKAPGNPYLSVNLNALEGKNATVSFGLSLSLYQGCTLTRDGAVKLATCDTWSKSKVGHANTNVPHFIEELVNNEVDTFVKAYSEVNPHTK